MRITIAAAGSIREPFYKDAIAEYTKRLSRYGSVNIVEVPDEKAPETLSPAQQQQVLSREGQRLIKALPHRAHTIALCIGGKRMDSLAFARHIQSTAISGSGEICFIIGGSLGLAPDVLRRAHLQLSFSDMTFCHALARLVLLEQVYRAFKINAGEPYHK